MLDYYLCGPDNSLANTVSTALYRLDDMILSFFGQGFVFMRIKLLPFFPKALYVHFLQGIYELPLKHF